MELKKSNYKIDSDIFKILFAVAICIGMAYITGNQNAIFFGGVAAIVCMQQSHEHTLRLGSYRFIGTIIGGVIGIVTILIETIMPYDSLGVKSMLIAVAALIAIYLCNLLSVSDATFINCIVFLNVVSNYGGKTEAAHAFLYVGERMLYTLVGAGSVYAISRFIHFHNTNYEREYTFNRVVQRVKGHRLEKDYSLGLRALKTGIAIFISVIIVYLTNNAEAIFFCSVGAVTCMQKNLKSTLSVAWHTFLGTIFGGVLGFLIVQLCNMAPNHFYIVEFVLILIAVFVVIYVCNVFKSEGMIPITSIMLLKMISHYAGVETTEHMLAFLFNPVLVFTAVGIVVAVIVNVIPFKKMYEHLFGY